MEITWRSVAIGLGAFVSIMVTILVAYGQALDGIDSRLQAAILAAREASQAEVRAARDAYRAEIQAVRGEMQSLRSEWQDHLRTLLARMDRGDQIEGDRFKAIEDAISVLAANGGDRFADIDRRLTILACQVGNVKICPGAQPRWDRPPGAAPMVNPEELLR